ncbi:YqgE/AlgH family protein [Aeromicrobium sp.]|uniref:YqgE/AlgH family protein n=1 Tax=Aeromicrobium sp. TaxID=1871063 RepID=UPI0025C0EF43|nr:YqgE/AlgH family protein [Aeromicrobium sp.]MCK5891967.1 YqgE/AlgH family protein [Aeromicrobium sp.]
MGAWRGRLLVATPAIADGVFARSVVFLLDHDDDGALGVIVNRPLESELHQVLPAWTSSATSPTLLFQGGPVATDGALAVGVLADPVSADGPPSGWRPMAGRVGLVDLDGPPPAPRQLVGLRVFAGYAGWSAGQLEGEVDEGSWLVVEADPADLISRDPESLWRDVVRRQSGDLRYWTTLPVDPGDN